MHGSHKLRLVVDGERNGDAGAGKDGTGVAGVAHDELGRADDGHDGGGSHMVAPRGHLLLAAVGRLLAAAGGPPVRGPLV